MIKKICIVLASAALFSASQAHAAFPDNFDGVILEQTGEATGIRNFAVTANLVFSVTTNPVNSFGRGINLLSNKANVWPVGPGNVSCCNANAWIFAKFNDRWYGHTFEFIRKGQTLKSEAALKQNHFKGASPWVPSFNYNRTGAIYGFMVAGLTRNGPAQSNVRERSNIFWYKWNVGPITACEAVPENPSCIPPKPDVHVAPILMLLDEEPEPPVSD